MLEKLMAYCGESPELKGKLAIVRAGDSDHYLAKFIDADEFLTTNWVSFSKKYFKERDQWVVLVRSNDITSIYGPWDDPREAATWATKAHTDSIRLVVLLNRPK